MARAFLVVMDSVGIGGAPDASTFFNGDLPDLGASTLAHIAQACAAGQAEEGRSGPLNLPNLERLGLGAAMRLASAVPFPGLEGTGALGLRRRAQPGHGYTVGTLGAGRPAGALGLVLFPRYAACLSCRAERLCGAGGGL